MAACGWFDRGRPLPLRRGIPLPHIQIRLMRQRHQSQRPGRNISAHELRPHNHIFLAFAAVTASHVRRRALSHDFRRTMCADSCTPGSREAHFIPGAFGSDAYINCVIPSAPY